MEVTVRGAFVALPVRLRGFKDTTWDGEDGSPAENGKIEESVEKTNHSTENE